MVEKEVKHYKLVHTQHNCCIISISMLIFALEWRPHVGEDGGTLSTATVNWRPQSTETHTGTRLTDIWGVYFRG